MIPHGGGLPRHVPRGARPVLEDLLGLRRYGAEMRRLLALDTERRAAPRAPVARSQGMDYAESRPYTPGDDVRRIDWRVTARTGRAHTKIFRLERGSDLYCIVDQRAPMHFGTRAAFKSVVAAQLAALAGWAAAAGGDRFGARIGGARGPAIPLGAADASVRALCAALADAVSGEQTPLDALAARAALEAPRGMRFLVISDFADPELVLERAARSLRAGGELLLAWVLDPMEERLPPPARYALTDGREHLLLDTARAGVRAAHARDLAALRRRLARLAAQPGTRACALRAGEDVFAALGRPLPAG